jgi:hypothetical protein
MMIRMMSNDDNAFLSSLLQRWVSLFGVFGSTWCFWDTYYVLAAFGRKYGCGFLEQC